MLMSVVETRSLPGATVSRSDSLVLDDAAQEIERPAVEELGFSNPRYPAEDDKRWPLAVALRSCLWTNNVFSEFSVERYKDDVRLQRAKAADRFAKRIDRYISSQPLYEKWRSTNFMSAILSHSEGEVIVMSIFSAVLLCLFNSCAAYELLTKSGVLSPGFVDYIFYLTIIMSLIIGAVLPFAFYYEVRGRDFCRTEKGQQELRDKLKRQSEANPYIEWLVTALSQYTLFARIPSSILEIVLKVKKACPEAEFLVHHTVAVSGPRASSFVPRSSIRMSPYFRHYRIVTSTKHETMLEDAQRCNALQIRFGEESYFIALWDEVAYCVDIWNNEDCGVTKKQLL